MHIPLDSKIKELADIPYTISFVIRKRQQLDNLNELDKKRRPPEDIIWNGSPEDLEEWLARAFEPNKKGENMIELHGIKSSEIES